MTIGICVAVATSQCKEKSTHTAHFDFTQLKGVQQRYMILILVLKFTDHLLDTNKYLQ